MAKRQLIDDGMLDAVAGGVHIENTSSDGITRLGKNGEEYSYYFDSSNRSKVEDVIIAVIDFSKSESENETAIINALLANNLIKAL